MQQPAPVAVLLRRHARTRHPVAARAHHRPGTRKCLPSQMHERRGKNREIEPPWTAPRSPALPLLRKLRGGQGCCIGAGARPAAALGRSPVLPPSRHGCAQDKAAQGCFGRRRGGVGAGAHMGVAAGEWSLITAGDGPGAGLSGPSGDRTRPLGPRSFDAVSPSRMSKTGSVLRVSAACEPDLCGHLGARSRLDCAAVASTLVAGG